MSKGIQVGWKSISKRVYELTNCHFSRRLCEKIRDMEVDSLSGDEREEASVLKNLMVLDGDEFSTRILLFESLCFGRETLAERLNTAENVQDEIEK